MKASNRTAQFWKLNSPEGSGRFPPFFAHVMSCWLIKKTITSDMNRPPGCREFLIVAGISPLQLYIIFSPSSRIARRTFSLHPPAVPAMRLLHTPSCSAFGPPSSQPPLGHHSNSGFAPPRARYGNESGCIPEVHVCVLRENRYKFSCHFPILPRWSWFWLFNSS